MSGWKMQQVGTKWDKADSARNHGRLEPRQTAAFNSGEPRAKQTNKQPTQWRFNWFGVRCTRLIPALKAFFSSLSGTARQRGCFWHPTAVTVAARCLRRPPGMGGALMRPTIGYPLYPPHLPLYGICRWHNSLADWITAIAMLNSQGRRNCN